jgi:hypothetical protein
MRPALALKKIQTNEPIKELTFTSITLEEHRDILYVIEQAKELESIRLEGSFLRDDFMSDLGKAIEGHNQLNSFGFKECGFSDNGPILFAEGLMKNTSLLQFEVVQCNNDEDIAQIIEAIDKQGKINFLEIDDCVFSGNKTIDALANLIINNSKTIHIGLKNSIISGDFDPILQAYQKSSNYIEWDFQGSEAINDEKIFERIQKLKPKKEKLLTSAIKKGIGYFSESKNVKAKISHDGHNHKQEPSK